MNWLRNKITSWLREDAVESGNRQYSTIGLAKAEVVQSSGLDTDPMRLNIYRANGGTVVETKIYDRKNDRTSNHLHIVGHEQDLGQSLAKIITMESLRG